ncbi:MFS transporter [Paracoccus sp. SCSIO 75233]|uniref:MFS transporter n=1 Tax=Paracoccus sp. SCSIO 75233 TaxID=3017782 RepID=UPI0022F00285|nr:MFS transporter [Paracoccus sp. SCSIO 75233]WBU53426.1 MFS transporter [Paracoccus sp. SCSIO 75233]
MRKFSTGIWVLVLGYTLSQFYRAFMAVLSPVLREELGADPGDLAVSSGIWFFCFAAMQIPVGGWLDRFGPRRTAAGLMLVAALGAAVFALAQTAWHLHIAMALIGIGCSPALMSAYYIFARNFSPREFGTLAGTFVAVGSLGNILSSSPMEAFAGWVGWREATWWMVAATVAVAVAEFAVVRDPDRLDSSHPAGRLVDILRLRALWFILPLFMVNYGASAAIRGLWAGPYLEEVYGVGSDVIGFATLMMGIAMIIGNYLAGPLVSLVGSVRRTILMGTAATVIVIGMLWLFTAVSLAISITLLALVGLSGASYVLLIAHGRAFLPPHLVGRGVTFLNMFSIGGTGVLQFASRPVYRLASENATPAEAYSILFLFFTIPLAIGLALYFLTPEAPDD